VRERVLCENSHNLTKIYRWGYMFCVKIRTKGRVRRIPGNFLCEKSYKTAPFEEHIAINFV
jgi:hypothetical protein